MSMWVDQVVIEKAGPTGRRGLALRSLREHVLVEGE